MKHIGSKGQLFSLDFLIAMGLAVLAMGMLLNYYETTTNAEKESRMQNELTAIALNASALMFEDEGNKCPGDFAFQGYEAYGCAIPGNAQSKFGTVEKEDLMIPENFKCNISWNGGTNNFCDDDPDDAINIVSIERPFQAVTGTIAKADYQKCIAGNCSVYTANTLAVKIWK